MPNFSIGTQIKKEVDGFKSKRIRIARGSNNDAESVRMASAKRNAYDFNQNQMVELIDLYWNSQFESGAYDKNNQRKLFLNIGKFRANVASKQIDIDPKDFRFIPDNFADPFTAYLLQKEFKEWAKEEDLGDLLNTWVDKLPRYGTIVGKAVGDGIEDLPLQNIVGMDQDAKSIQESSHFIELHAALHSWDIQAMPDWDAAGLTIRYDETLDVYERSGYVPVAWLKKQKGVADFTVDPSVEYVDSRVIVAYPKNDRKLEAHVLFAERIVDDRGYREKHWDRQHGRWLGVGVMEDELENQRAKNVGINLIRRSLQWSAKRVMQSSNADMAAKNLVRDVKDGEILEVGPNGEISEVPLSQRMNADFSEFLNEFERNADQKAFTYEAGLAGMGNSRTAFRLGALLTQAAQAFFKLKRQQLTGFVKELVEDFMFDRFISDLGSKERIVTMFEGEPGFDMLKNAALQFVRSELGRVSLLSGQTIDANAIAQQVGPAEAFKQFPFVLPSNAYDSLKFKFDFVSVDDDVVDTESIIKSLTMLYQALAARNDPRAEQVLQRISAIGGIYLPSSETLGPTAGGGAPPAPESSDNSVMQGAMRASGFPSGGTGNKQTAALAAK